MVTFKFKRTNRYLIFDSLIIYISKELRGPPCIITVHVRKQKRTKKHSFHTCIFLFGGKHDGLLLLRVRFRNTRVLLRPRLGTETTNRPL